MDLTDVQDIGMLAAFILVGGMAGYQIGVRKTLKYYDSLMEQNRTANLAEDLEGLDERGA